jgi:hypothetical protein
VRVDIIPPGAPAWDEVLRRAEHDFYHLPAYAAFCGRADGGEPLAIHVEDGPRRMLLPTIVRPIGDGLRDAASPYGYSGPLVRRRRVRPRGLPRGREGFARDRIVTLLSGSPSGPAARGGRDGGRPRPHGVDRPPALRRSCGADPVSYRQQITWALGAGYRVFFDERFEHLPAFVVFYCETMERVGVSRYYLFDEFYFAKLRKTLGRHLLLCVIIIENAIAAKKLFVETGNLVQYHLSKTDARFLRQKPAKLMLHFVRS